MEITAAVTRAKSAPFQIEQVELEAPRANEVLVRMVASGICHSDIGARDQILPIPLPIVLGHEGAGVVEAVGTAVTKLNVGDHVVLSRLSCGQCGECAAGRSNFCVHITGLNLGGCRPDGSTGLCAAGERLNGRFFGQSSFATHALAHERNATPIDPGFDLRLAPAFACGTLTGAGAVLNGLKPEIGSSIAIFGAGAVGLAALLATVAVGCTTIIAIDRNAQRLALARELGATHVVQAGDVPLAQAVRAIVPAGVDFSIEATGVADVARAAADCLCAGGTCGLLGIGPMGQEVRFDHLQLALMGVAIRGFPTGIAEPDLLIPRLIALHAAGRFPVERLVTHFPFHEINAAATASCDGSAIKPILLFDAA